MKRQRGNEGSEYSSLDLANCLMLLSQTQYNAQEIIGKPRGNGIEFECKTCKRKFSSFQALGGHRASHKRPKLDGEEELKEQAKSLSLGNKPRTHECSICGAEFSLGQALGGHMRKHRPALHNQDDFASVNRVVPKVPVLKRSNSTRVVVCLDLNLTPLENDLEVVVWKHGSYRT